MIKPRKIPGWLHISQACKRYGYDYEDLRRLVTEKVFTRGRFTSDRPTAPIYLRIDELKAFQSHGVNGVRAVQAKNERKQASEAGA